MDQGILDLSAGSNLIASNLTGFTSSELVLDPSVGLTTAPLTDVDGTRIAISGGLNYTDVVATTYEYVGNNIGSSGAILSADGAGSVLDLSSLDTLIDGRNFSGAPIRSVVATGGALINLSNVQTVEGGISNDILSFDFTADGTVLLDELVSTTSRTQLSLDSGVSLTLPNLVSMDEGILDLSAGSSLIASNLTGFTSSELVLDPSVSLTTAPLTDVDGTRIAISGGLNYTDVVATTYEYVGVNLGGSGAILSADGAGSILDLSSLESYIDGRNFSGAPTRSVIAMNGGTIDLSGLKSIEGAATDDIAEFRAESGGSILLHQLGGIARPEGISGRLSFDIQGTG
jgi:hypothetical protein